MTISADFLYLAKKFNLRELHAAQGGREVLDALNALITASNVTTVQELQREVQQNLKFLIEFLPPYAPPIKNINRVLLCLERAVVSNLDLPSTKNLVDEISTEIADPIQNAYLIAEALTTVLQNQSIIYTHTLSETVLNSILELATRGKVGMVYVTESRPNNDGWETARKLAKCGIQTILTIDAAMPFVISQAQLMLSGAEIINENGAVLGKIGAYTAAALSEKNGIPVWVLADSTKIWPQDIDNLNPYFITAEDIGLKITNPALKIGGSFFERIPPEYVTGYATELGLLYQAEVRQYASRIQVSQWLRDQLSVNTYKID